MCCHAGASRRVRPHRAAATAVAAGWEERGGGGALAALEAVALVAPSSPLRPLRGSPVHAVRVGVVLRRRHLADHVLRGLIDALRGLELRLFGVSTCLRAYKFAFVTS